MMMCDCDYCYEKMISSEWALLVAPFVTLILCYGVADVLDEAKLIVQHLFRVIFSKKSRTTSSEHAELRHEHAELRQLRHDKAQLQESAQKDRAYKKLRRENAALRVRKVRSVRKLRRENAILRQQLAVAEAKLAENGRHEDGEIEIRDPEEEEVDVDTVAVVPCEFDADLDFPPLALAEDLEDDEEEETPPVDRHQPEPEPALIPDNDDEITLGHDSPPRNSTPPSMVATPPYPTPTPTQKDTSPSPHMDENASQSVIESSSGPEDSTRLGRILTVAYSKKARRMVHVRRSARLLSAGTGSGGVEKNPKKPEKAKKSKKNQKKQKNPKKTRKITCRLSVASGTCAQSCRL